MPLVMLSKYSITWPSWGRTNSLG